MSSSKAVPGTSTRVISARHVSILDTRTGQLVHSLNMAGPVQADRAHQLVGLAVVDPQRHRAIMVGMNPGMGAPKMLTIRIFDTQSGMLLRTIALPPDAWSELAGGGRHPHGTRLLSRDRLRPRWHVGPNLCACVRGGYRHSPASCACSPFFPPACAVSPS